MDNNKASYENFLNEVHPVYREAADQIHDYLLRSGCKIKIQPAKSGYVVSYSDPRTKKVAANFVFRKNGLIIRIYGENFNKYIDFLEELPAGMIKSMEKSAVCKRLIDPSKCNSRCGMGYDFTVKGVRFQKCRYGCFMFEINDENIPFIKAFVENEIRERIAV